MIVRTLSNGREVIGLYIGTRNARRNFRKRTKAIELQLGHLRIRCALAPDFWQGRPEIRDRRLGVWLESKIFHETSCRADAPLTMVPVERNTFRLRPFIQPKVSAHGLVRIGLAAARTPEKKTQCGIGPCRVRNFIACSQNLVL